ncbi:protein NIM1-INTERACTING 1-like [Durio zibethinus]|uniref:Protein NIM1-INTERACTING 1-like n=1 Tax=Durio zibethinus TaxID=66656 RepID=A0A6P6A4E9_DURZI|nr:protein NIM1-INTERACTING 1-like [Durio zibethinus]
MAAEKRSHVCNGEDEEEQEDHKMEQFFALIRNFHEARNRRKDELRQRDHDVSTKKQNKIRRLNDEQSSWVPRFEWADFTEEIDFRRPPIIFPSPYNKKDDKKKQRVEEDDGLDLKLAL